ncbi:MAG: hypothetical protein PVF17_02695 [Ignavibacteria bacterium]|jgi:hypothetical protein
MAKNKQTKKNRQIGKTKVEKKPLIDPKYKNTFWTVLILLILIIFFIVNNTRTEPEHGPYPPGYKPPGTDSTLVN